MRVRDVMTDSVRTISPTTTAEDAWQLMQQTGIRHLVVARDSRLVGVVSDRDLGSLRGASLRKGRTVAEVMTADVVTVLPETPVRKAADVMRGRSIGCLVVAVGDRVRGVVTVADLLELLGRGASRPVLATAGGHRSYRSHLPPRSR